MSRSWSFHLIAVLSLAFAGCRTSGGSGGRGTGDSGYRDVVAKCVRLMAFDLDSARDTYPELAGWRSPPAGTRRIDHATKAGAISVTVSRPAEKKAGHEFPNLDLAVFVELSGGRKFVRAAGKIVASRLVPLRDLDAAVGRSLKGFVSDLAAVKGKYPELSGFSAGAVRGGRLYYVSGGFSVTVWADLAPERAAEVRCFPLCARVAGGSRAARGTVLSLLEKNLEPLRELQRRTGGWRVR